MPKRLYVENDLLEQYIDRSGLRKSFICDKLGISREAFIKKRKGDISFTKAEEFVLCSLLNIEEDANTIFLPKSVKANSTKRNADETEE